MASKILYIIFLLFTITTLSQAQPPVNDDCNNAIPYLDSYAIYPLNGCTIPNTLDLSNAGNDAGNDNPLCDNSSNFGVWFTWTATSEALRFEPGSGNPGFAIYESGSCGSLNNIGCFKSTESIGGLVIGNDYIFFIWSDVFAATVEFCLEEFTPIINDKCENAIPYTSQFTMYEQGQCVTPYPNVIYLNQTTPDTNVVCQPFTTYRGAWYTWIATSSGITFKGGYGSPKLFIYDQGTCASTAMEPCGLNSIFQDIYTGFVVGNEYLFYINSKFNPDSIVFCIEKLNSPPNDNCELASPFPYPILSSGECSGYPNVLDLTNATFDDFPNQPWCANQNVGVWFTWVATSTNLYFQPGSNNPAMAIFNSGTCGTPEIEYSPFGCLNGTAGSFTGMTVGNSYLIYIWSDDIENAVGEIVDFCLEDIPEVENNTCANALPLIVDNSLTCSSNSILNISTALASDSGEGTPTCGNYNERDVFYEFTVPTGSTFVTFERQNLSSPANVEGAIYSGACGSLSEVACFIDNQWPFTANNLTPGQTYYLRLWMTGSNAFPTFDLCAHTVILPENDVCTSALTLNVSSDENCTNTVHGFTNFATIDDDGTCQSSNTGVWYHFTPSTSEPYHIKLSNASSNLILELMTGVCGDFNSIVCGTNEIVANLQAGISYNLLVSSINNHSEFDLCVHPYDISSNSGNFVGVNTNAPLTTLDINGGIRVGNTDIPLPGSIRWTGLNFEGYGGTGWQPFQSNPNDELQAISKSGNLVTLSKGGGSFTIDDADANASNELQTISKFGSTVTLSNGGGSFTDAVNDADASPTNELQTISKSGTTVTLSNGGGSFTDAVDDADNSATNELQTISKSGTTVTLSNGGGSFTDAVNDADNSATNELQTISKSGTTVTLSNGGGSFTDAVDDADNSATNELQTISKSGTTVTLSNGGGSFTDSVNDADASTANETITSTSLNTAYELNIVEAGIFHTTDLSILDNGWVKSGIDDLNYDEGNVMIGSSAAPTQKLEIYNGGMLINRNSNSTTPHLEIEEAVANDGARIIFSNAVETANRWTLFGHSDNTHANSTFNIFYNGIGNMLTAKGNGNMGIKGDPDADLHVFHSNSGGSGGIKLQNVSNNEFARLYVSSGDGNLRIYFDTTGLKGTFNDVTGAYTTVSDRRMKENFEDLPFDWKTFNQLTPLTYNFKNDRNDRKYIGLIAQDVQQVYPQLVHYAEDEDRYTMDYSGFGVIAIKAVQELKQEIEEKDKKILDLEDRLSKIEKLLNK